MHYVKIKLICTMGFVIISIIKYQSKKDMNLMNYSDQLMKKEINSWEENAQLRIGVLMKQMMMR